MIPGKLRWKKIDASTAMSSVWMNKTKRGVDNTTTTKTSSASLVKNDLLNKIMTSKIKESDEIETSWPIDKPDNEESERYRGMTQAEKNFYERKKKELPQKITKMSRTSFKEKYQQYYKSWTKLPEHHDIPKVGPG